MTNPDGHYPNPKDLKSYASAIRIEKLKDELNQMWLDEDSSATKNCLGHALTALHDALNAADTRIGRNVRYAQQFKNRAS